jgi:hypothetical protein
MGKQEAINAVRDAQKELERVYQSAKQEDWAKQAHTTEGGWNAKQLLCHIAATSNIPSMYIGMVKQGNESLPARPGFNLNEWNAGNVSEREAKSLDEIVGEIAGNHKVNIETLEATDDATLAKQWKLPWGPQGPLADMIITWYQVHEMGHLKELGI